MLSAGRAILLTEGWDEVTHGRVAEDARVARSTVYRHWSTTEDLVEDVLLHVLSTRQPVRLTGDLEQDVRATLRVLVDDLNDDLLRGVLVTLLQRAETSERFSRMLGAVRSAGEAALRSVLAAADVQRHLRSAADLDRLVTTLVGPLMYEALVRRQPITTDTVDGVLELVVPSLVPRGLHQ